MKRIIEYAILSKHVYNTEHHLIGAPKKAESFNSSDIATFKAQRLSGWSRALDVDPSMHPRKPFYSQLYIKFLSGQAVAAVVAIRGTVMTIRDNLDEDISTFWSEVLGIGHHDKLPGYRSLAMLFFKKAYDYVKKYLPRARLSITGHSLGGAIAQMITLSMRLVPSVVFNSPGVGHMFADKADRFGLIHNINAKYGIINKIGQTIGHLQLIDIPEKEAEARNMCENYNKALYKMSEIGDTAAEHDPEPLSKAALYAVGAEMRLASFSESMGTLKDTQAVQAGDAKCTKTLLTEPRYDAKSLFMANMGSVGTKLLLCDANVLGLECKQVIIAQHSIANMVNALAKVPSLALAV